MLWGERSRPSERLAVGDLGYRPPSPSEDIFEFEPVPLDIFIQDKAFLGQEWMLSDIQWDLVRIIERVYMPETFELLAEHLGGYWAEPIPMKNLISAEWGKGGGKDSTVRVSAMRVAYLLMCLRSPQRYYKMPMDDSIHILNIAYNAPQAQRAFFEPLTRMVRRGWFKDRAEPKRDTIEYDKNVTAISGHSDAEAQEGLNIMLGVADEIDAFKAKGEMVGLGNRAREASTSAESILNMIESSAKSRFPRTYKRVAISYPRYLGSTIQKLTAQGKEDNRKYGETSVYFASGPFATWEVNPLRSRDEFDEDYRNDPQEAAAKYECKPYRAQNSYFRNMQIFKQATDSEDQPVTVDYRIVETTSKTTKRTVRGWEPIFTFAADFLPIAGARYAMHGDLALRGDRAGIALSHVERWEERSEQVENAKGEIEWVNTTVPVLRNDFTICFESDIAAIDYEQGSDVVLPREIQIRWARMLAFELIKRGFSIGSFTFDGFQSADTIQILTSHGIESERLSTDLKPELWKTPKDVASEARLRMPWSLLLFNELEGLSQMDNGKVDHPPAGSKDLADAFCCSLVGAIALGGQEDENKEVVEPGGSSSFAVGEAVAGLTIYHNAGMGLPFGMKGMSFGG